VEVSLARIFQSGVKTDGGVTVGGARGTIAEVRRRQVEDERVDATGWVGPCYLTFAVFNVLCPRGIVVI
jgi:hypothetical protein